MIRKKIIDKIGTLIYKYGMIDKFINYGKSDFIAMGANEEELQSFNIVSHLQGHPGIVSVPTLTIFKSGLCYLSPRIGKLVFNEEKVNSSLPGIILSHAIHLLHKHDETSN